MTGAFIRVGAGVKIILRLNANQAARELARLSGEVAEHIPCLLQQAMANWFHLAKRRRVILARNPFRREAPSEVPKGGPWDTRSGLSDDE